MNKTLPAQKFDGRMRGTICAVPGLGTESVPRQNCLFIQPKVKHRVSAQYTGSTFLSVTVW